MFKITLDPSAAGKLEALGQLILRLGAGGMLALQHGWPKLQNFSDKAGSFPDPLGVSPHLSLGLAVFGEFFCGILVVLGLWTRLATIPPIITMAVATFIHHSQDPFQKKELALLYLVCFGVIFLTGPGKHTVGSLLPKRKA